MRRFWPYSAHRDFGTGNELHSHLLSKLARLELHHIFPKALLATHGYDRSERNALANFCFLTQKTNLAIGARPPAEYLPEYESKNPGVLASQWIPADPDLWVPERYLDFLDARRRLLAAGANDFLDSLIAGTAQPAPVGGVAGGPQEDRRLAGLAQEANALGLAPAALDHEIVDPESGARSKPSPTWPGPTAYGPG